MKPSSAMAFVSAMLGAAMPWARSFFSAWEIASSFFSQPEIKIVAAARITAHVLQVEDPGVIFALLCSSRAFCETGRATGQSRSWPFCRGGVDEAIVASDQVRALQSNGHGQAQEA